MCIRITSTKVCYNACKMLQEYQRKYLKGYVALKYILDFSIRSAVGNREVTLL